MVRSNEDVTGGGGLWKWVSLVDVMAVLAVVVVVVDALVVPLVCKGKGCTSKRRFDSVNAVVKRFFNRAFNTTLSPCDTRWAFP